MRPFSDEQRQFCVHYSGRLSVTTPISTLQRVSKAGGLFLVSREQCNAWNNYHKKIVRDNDLGF